jgi:hypothetical protein
MSGRMRRWCREVDEVMMRRVERLECSAGLNHDDSNDDFLSC